MKKAGGAAVAPPPSSPLQHGTSSGAWALGCRAFRSYQQRSNRSRRPSRFDPIVRRRRIIVALPRLWPIGRRRHVTNVLHDDSVRIPDWKWIFRHVLAESDDGRLESRMVLGPN